MRRLNDGRVIKDVGRAHMVLEDVQFNHLKMIFIQQRVWEIMWNQIPWKGIYQQAFGRGMLEDGAKLKNYLIKLALYDALQEYTYETLENDIFIGGKAVARSINGRTVAGRTDGVVITALKTRLERMKCVYQIKALREGEWQHTELTINEELQCERKLWSYLADETIKPD
jgi:hypothetical protein